MTPSKRTMEIIFIIIQAGGALAVLDASGREMSTRPTLAEATEQFAADGIAMVIDNDERLGSDESRNYSKMEINELRETMTAEGRLFREVMSNYEKRTRPVFNASHVVNINLSFTFSQVLNVEEKEQSMSVILWMDHYWNDEKLVWDPDDFDGISQMKIPSSSIWLPDIVLYNTAEERIVKTTYTGSRAYLKYNGDVYWPPVKRYMSSCNIDITYFPFDDQICFLKLGSWSYDGFQVNIWNNNNTMDMSQALKNSEFEVVDSRVKRFITKYDCCEEPYPDIKVYIHIRRQTIQHVFNIVIPCVTLSIICMVGFLIPPDKNDEKISVQLTVLFSLSLFMLLVAESTPRTSESVPLISIYLTALMCITAMSTTAHVVCDKLVSSASVRTEVPYLANKLLNQLTQCCQKRKKIHKPDIVISNSCVLTDQIPMKNCVEQTSNPKPVYSPSHLTPPPHARGRRGHSLSVIDENNAYEAPALDTNNTSSSEPSEEGLQGLFHHLKVRQDKMRDDLQETAKWYKVATKMDRIFFWSYGLSVVVLTFYAFVFKPMQKKVEL